MMVLLMAGNTPSHRQSAHSYQPSSVCTLGRGCQNRHCTDNIQTRQMAGTRYASAALFMIYRTRSPAHFRDSTLIWWQDIPDSGIRDYPILTACYIARMIQQ